MSNTSEVTQVQRPQVFEALNRFVSSRGSGVAFLRGRRRVGKTWALDEYQKNNRNCFYYMGEQDSSTRQQQRSFVLAWSEFSGDPYLKELDAKYLDWRKIFASLADFFIAKSESYVLIFDEIQWIAVKNSGFVSRLKEAWVSFEKSGNVKIIVCGSSNRFFSDYVTGSEKVLRGIRTRSSIWVSEFSLQQVAQNYLPSWNRHEACLAYMMLGGIPYYLQTIDPRKGFIQGVNDAIFTSSSIFLEEVDEILRLEFNSQGVETIKKLLIAADIVGSSKSTIAKKCDLPLSTVSEAIDQLVTYELMFRKSIITGDGKCTPSNIYYVRDSFLNLYCQVLHKYQKLILANSDQLLFTAQIIRSESGYYIPGYTGRAFELMVEKMLLHYSDNSYFCSKFRLRDSNYEVGTYWSKSTQIDLVVKHNQDRIIRLIETKWSQASSSFQQHLDQIRTKPYPVSDGYQVKRFLVVAYNVSRNQRDEALDSGVVVLGLDDMFEG